MPNELIVAKEYEAVLSDPAATLTAMRENIGDTKIQPYELSRYKVPSGGGLAWTNAEGKPEVEFSGVILHMQDGRRYWEKPFGTGGGAIPPDCQSEDGQAGVGNPGGICSKCPLAEPGSGRSDSSSACRPIRLLFVLKPGELLPCVLSLPVTSLKGARQYMLRLASKGTPYYGVVTKFSLAMAKNPDGVDYSVVNLSVAERFDAVMVEKFRKVRDAYRPLVTAVKVTDAD